MSEAKSNTTVAQSSLSNGDRANKSSLAVSGVIAGEHTPLPANKDAAIIPQSKPRTVSERKLRANRANARKSTGPRTARGKVYSRRNALLHGLTSRTVLFDPQGKQSDPSMEIRLQNLKHSLPKGQDADPRVETIAHEYAHQCLATEIEARLAQNGFDDIASPVSLRNLIRYRTASERALLKSLTSFERSATK